MGSRSASRRRRSGRPAAWRVILRDVRDGRVRDADEVRRRVHGAYRSPCSRRTHLSRIRSRLADDDRHRALVTRLRPEAETTRACRKVQRDAVMAKLRRARVFDAEALWTEAASFVFHCTDEAERGVTPQRGWRYRLALALMTLTGRRQAEILNGRSAFASLRGGDLQPAVRAHAARFRGQLKRHRSRAPAYPIPLLCPRDRVVRALEVLRTLQPSDVASWDNDRVSRRYQSSLGQYMRKHPVYGRMLKRVHDLRGTYLVMATQMFDFGDDALDSYVAMQLLGEGSPEPTLVYNTFKSKTRVPKEPIGAWPLEPPPADASPA